MKKLLFLSLFIINFSYISADQGISQKEILLGSHQPLSGIGAQFSVISKSADAYFQYVNDQGGVHGRKIKCLFVDDAFQPDETREKVKNLIWKDQVFLIFNGLGNETHSTIADWLESLKIPDFFIGSPDMKWTSPRKEYLFGFQPTPKVEARILAKYILEHFPSELVVIWHQNHPMANMATSEFSRLLQGKIRIKNFQHSGLKDLDLEKTIENIKRLQAGIVVLFTIPEYGVPFLKQAYQQGLRTRTILSEAMADSRLLKWAGKNAMENVSVLTYLPLASQSDDAGIRLHRSVLSTYQPDVEINRWTIYGQAVAEAMTEILYRSGRSLTREKIIQTAENMSLWQGSLTPPLTMTHQQHLPVTRLRIAQVNNGSFKYITDWIEY